MEKEIECEAERGEQNDQSRDEQQSAAPIGALKLPETARLPPAMVRYLGANLMPSRDASHHANRQGLTSLALNLSLTRSTDKGRGLGLGGGAQDRGFV